MPMNPPNEAAFIHRQLGEVNATLKSISNSMDRDREEAKEHREKMTEKLDHVERRVEDMDDRLLTLERVSMSNAAKLDNEVMPTVRKINIWEQRGIGFLAFAGFAGTGLGATIVAYGDDIRTFLGSFFK